MMRLRWILLLAGVLLLASAVAGIAQPHFGHAAGTTAAKTITVTGNGSVTTVPDRAGFDFTVETRAATAKAALAQNSDAAAAIVAAVKNAGVADADIQTSQVSLSPQTKQDGTQIIGYIASNSISVKSTIAKAGSIVDAAVTLPCSISPSTERREPSPARANTFCRRSGSGREEEGSVTRSARVSPPCLRPPPGSA